MKRIVLVIVLLIVVFGLVCGCGKTQKRSAVSLEVFVPCGMVEPVNEVVSLFEAQHPGVKIGNRISCVTLLIWDVVRGGLRPSVFLSMGDVELRVVEEKGLIVRGSKRAFASSGLVLVTPKNNPGRVKSIADLANNRVKKIGLVDPEFPTAAERAKQALQKLGIWDKIKGKVVEPQAEGVGGVSAKGVGGEKPEFGEPVRVALAGGEVGAAITYKVGLFKGYEPGEPKRVPENLELIAEIPPELYEPIYCYAALIKGGKHGKLAAEFIAFLLTEEVQRVFEKYEFGRAP